MQETLSVNPLVDGVSFFPSVEKTSCGCAQSVSLSLLRMNPSDPLHIKLLCQFIQKEADFFGAKFNENKMAEILSLKGKNLIIHFALAAFECSGPSATEIVGCSVQFPTAIPKWNKTRKAFDFLPAIYSEDIIVCSPDSDKYRSITGRGIGTDFFGGRIPLAAHTRSQDLPNGVVAAALIGEQAWPGGSRAAALFKKFDTTMVTSRDETILVFSNASLKRFSKNKIHITRLATSPKPNSYAPLDNVFGACWNGQHSSIAATFCDAVSTFNGIPVVRASFSSHGKMPKTQELGEILSTLFVRAQTEIARRKWTAESHITPLLRIHALNEPDIHKALRNLGAIPRILGNEVMYPLRTDFVPQLHNVIGKPISPSRPLMGRCKTEDHFAKKV